MVAGTRRGDGSPPRMPLCMKTDLSGELWTPLEPGGGLWPSRIYTLSLHSKIRKNLPIKIRKSAKFFYGFWFRMFELKK